MILAKVKNNPTWTTLALRSFKYKGSKTPYMLPAMLAKTIANINSLSVLLSKGCLVVDRSIEAILVASLS